MSESETRYPFPPEYSMFWDQPDSTHTYQQAVDLFNAQSESDKSRLINPLVSRKADDTGPSYPFPDEHSLYWESTGLNMGYQEAVTAFDAQDPISKKMKLNPVRNVLTEGEEVIPQQEPVVETVLRAIIPVRYAVDTTLNNAERAPKATGSFSRGHMSSREQPYTLRQLRDGWVYVYNMYSKRLDEYQLQGSTFTDADGVQASCLHYSVDAKLKIAFSSQQWTPRIKTLMSTHPMQLIGFMRRLDPDSLYHIGDISVLSSGEVADIGSAPAHQFKHSTTPLTEGEIDAKPLTQAADWQVNIAPDQDAVVIALEDPIADIEDIHLALTRAIAEEQSLLTADEEKGHKWQMAQIAHQIGRVNLPEAAWPESVNSANKYAFEADLNKYLKQSHKTNNSHELEELNDDLLGLAYSDDLETSLQKKKLKDDWGYTPQGSLVNEWANKKRLYEQVRWDELDEFSDSLNSELGTLHNTALHHANNLNTCLENLKGPMLRLGLDEEATLGQQTFLNLMGPLPEGLIYVAEVQDNTRTLTCLYGDASLLALAPFGGSKALKKAINKEMADKEAGNTVMGTSEAPTALGNIDNYKGLFEHADITNSGWFKALDSSIQQVVHALSAAVTCTTEVTASAWQSIVTHITAKQIPTSPAAAYRASLRAIFIESMVSKVAVMVNSDYKEAESKYQTRLEEANQEVKKAEQQLKRDQETQRYKEKKNAKKSGVKNEKVNYKKNLSAAKDNFRRALADYPNLWIYRAKKVNEALANVMNDTKTKMIDNVKSTGKQIKNAYIAGGGNGSLVALLNLANLMAITSKLNLLPDDDPANADIKQELAASFFWTVGAIAEVAQGQSVSLVKAGGDEVLNTTVKKAIQANPELAQVLRQFNRTMFAMSFAYLAASSIEIWRLGNRIADSDDGLEQFLCVVQIGGHGAIGAASFFRLFAFTRGASLSAFLMPWMAAAFFWGGLVIVATAMLLNYLKKTPLEKWLKASFWGKDPKGWSAEEELLNFEKIVYQPEATVTIKKIVTRMPTQAYDPGGVAYERTITVELPVTANNIKVTSPAISESELQAMCSVSKGRLVINEGRSTREVTGRYGIKQEVNTLSDLILDVAFTVANELAYHITVGGNVANGESANVAPHTLVPASLSGSPSLLLNNKVTT